jgi:uncharacterized protein (DUF58 family)
MDKSAKNISNVFVSLQDLIKMESMAKGFSFLSRKQKVKSILGGKHASKLRGRGLDFEEVRNYVAGDDIRNIDWKVTARTKKTHTKVFSEEKEKPALIIVDQSKSMFFGSQYKTKSVVAAELAALAAFRILKEGDRVGGVVFADNGVDVIFPKRDRKNIFRFFEQIVQRNKELELSEPVNFDVALKDVFAKVRNIISHDFLILIISDFHRYSPEVIKELAYMSRHNDVVLAKVFDPLERDIPNAKIVAGSGNSQSILKGNQRKIRARFQVGFDDEYQQFEAQMKKYRIPLFKIDTIEAIDMQLKEILLKPRR